MPTPKTAWPTAAQVTTALASLPTPVTLPAGFDVASQVAAAVREWDTRTRYRPFFQESATPVAIPFDPPGPNDRGPVRGGSYRLALGNGLVSLTSLLVSVNAAAGDEGYELTAGVDFHLGPPDAPSKGEPYTEVEFLSVRRGLPRSIVILGLWGFCKDEIPDDAWQGVMDLATANCLHQYREGLAIADIETKDDEVSIRRSIELIGKMGETLRSKGERTLRRYKLLH